MGRLKKGLAVVAAAIVVVVIIILVKKNSHTAAEVPIVPVLKAQTVGDLGWKPYDTRLLRRDGNADIQCLSHNASECIIFKTDAERATAMNSVASEYNIQPLTCGDQHRAKFGVSGYEDKNHWCSVGARTVGAAL